MTEHVGEANGTGRRICIVASRFNVMVTDRLLDGARDTLLAHGVAGENVDVIRVPGAWEIAPAAGRAATLGYDAIVALGCVVRGETPHFDYLCRAVTDGLVHVQRVSGIPVGFGVLTTESVAQALERAGGAAGHAGARAAEAALEMCDLLARLGAAS
ncbi:MAG: 6,7-dimethyl-8-ribityllumazine synthase [Gemmatimonadota bacterium]